MGAKLVKTGIQNDRSIFLGNFDTIDIESYTIVFIPRESKMRPLFRFWQRRNCSADPDPCKVDICNEGIEAVAVKIDSEPAHVPACMVGISNPENREFGVRSEEQTSELQSPDHLL